MALPEWNENNKIKWVGVRPGFDGDYLSVHGAISNAALTLYTIPVGKGFLLFNYSVNIRSNGAANGTIGYFQVLDSGSATIHMFLVANILQNDTKHTNGNLSIPMEFVAGDFFQLYSPNALLESYASITGVLIDA